jgi:DNA-directed RNA polymerase specialized sigma24 family protein
MTALDSCAGVEAVLGRYADPYQPRAASLLSVGSTARGSERFPFPRLLEDLEARAELRARLASLKAVERRVVVRWYVEGASPADIARDVGCSERHVRRLRASAIRHLVEMGDGSEFADADVAEFA